MALEARRASGVGQGATHRSHEPEYITNDQTSSPRTIPTVKTLRYKPKLKVHTSAYKCIRVRRETRLLSPRALLPPGFGSFVVCRSSWWPSRQLIQGGGSSEQLGRCRSLEQWSSCSCNYPAGCYGPARPVPIVSRGQLVLHGLARRLRFGLVLRWWL